jgi:hypothetical protein
VELNNNLNKEIANEKLFTTREIEKKLFKKPRIIGEQLSLF